MNLLFDEADLGPLDGVIAFIPRKRGDALDDIFYIVKNVDVVMDFLDAKPKAIDLLRVITTKLPEYFDFQSPPTLTVETEPYGEKQLLLVNISCANNLPKAQKALDRLDDEWWLDHSDDAEGAIEIALVP